MVFQKSVEHNGFLKYTKKNTYAAKKWYRILNSKLEVATKIYFVKVIIELKDAQALMRHLNETSQGEKDNKSSIRKDACPYECNRKKTTTTNKLKNPIQIVRMGLAPMTFAILAKCSQPLT